MEKKYNPNTGSSKKICLLRIFSHIIINHLGIYDKMISSTIAIFLRHRIEVFAGV